MAETIAQAAGAASPPMQTTKNQIAIEMAAVHKWYGDFHVLRDINLTVERRERIVICGPSGSGKSTMIRCINRLEEHQAGQIVVDGVERRRRLVEQHDLRAHAQGARDRHPLLLAA